MNEQAIVYGQRFLLIYLLLVNFVALVLMFADKRKAKRDQWRIPESTLLLSAAIGGSIGALIGMRWFHHKTRKPKFFIGIPAILVLQLALAAGAYWHFIR